jgi:hypothetical protein
MNSSAGLVPGAYSLDHAAATFQPQGQQINIALQNDPTQADPMPVVQYPLTAPLTGGSALITPMNFQFTPGGVSQGAATTVTGNVVGGTNTPSMVTTAVGNGNLVNTAGDPLGAGLNIGGLKYPAQLAADEPALITADQQPGFDAFDPANPEGPNDNTPDLAPAKSGPAAENIPIDGSDDLSASASATDSESGDAPEWWFPNHD